LPLAHSVSLTQLLVQPPEPQRNGAHSCVPAEQLPLPLQNAVGWKTVPVQNDVAQLMLAGAWVHAPPVHVPVLPHGGLARQRPWGSEVPFATDAQVPLPVMLQAWQVPHDEVVQQTLSTQLPVPHSASSLQVAPAAFLATHIALALQ
jgi:hypothetical protein